MGDKIGVSLLGPGFFPTDARICADKKLRQERERAEADMAWKYANLHMPEDIRSRARAWGMEAFCEVLWNNAFQAGYREALRARQEGE